MVMGFLPTFATALAAVYLGSLVLEWAILQRLLDRAARGIPVACGTAAAIGFTVHFLLSRDEWWYDLRESGFAFAGALLLVFALRMLALRRRQLRDGPDADWGDVFR